MKLYIFNPDTDMALADNNENYMAPASARRMAEDLALLPIWYAQPGSAVLAPSAYNADFLKQMQVLFRLQVQLATEPELPDYSEAQIMPWGWNPAIRRRLLKGGVQERKLPALSNLMDYRALASRINTSFFYDLFHFPAKIDYVCGICYLIEGDGKLPFIDEAVKDFNGSFLFKSLWSGSGKGLCWCRHGLTKSASDWCLRELGRHKAIIAEPIYNKVEDFAMEFYSNGQGKVLFIGYSRFLTNEKGAYCGNILTSDTEVEQWIQQYVPWDAFIRIRARIQEGLETLYSRYYTGYLGVDMMVCRQEGEHPYAIHPYVEVNLRMNMGIVSHTLCDNFIAPGCKGRFTVEYYPTHEALLEKHEQDMKSFPMVVQEGRLVSGYLPLVPVTPKSLYRAYVCVPA